MSQELLNDSRLVRELVYRALKKPMGGATPELEAVLTAFYNEACYKGYLQPRMMNGIPAPPSLFNIPPQLQNAVRGVIWDLIIQGMIVPGTPNQLGSSGLPSFVITDWGKKRLEKGEYLPFDAGEYISRVKSEVSNVDPYVILYLKDALASFRVGAYLASAVMTGVASERVLLLLRDEVQAALSTVEGKKKFAAATKGISVNRVFHEIWKRLEPNQEALSQFFGREDVKLEISGIFDLIRKTRNDAGHPTGRDISRDEADSMLHLFPVYCKTAYTTMEWLRSNPLP